MKQKITLHLIAVVLFTATSLIQISLKAQKDVKLDLRRVVVNLDQGQLIGLKRDVRADEEIDINGPIGLQYGDEFIAASNFSENELKAIFSESFLDLGFRVEGYSDPFIELRESIPVDFAFVFYIEDLKFNYDHSIYKNVFLFDKFSSLITLRVRILDKTNDQIVFDGEFRSRFHSEEKGFHLSSLNLSNYIPAVIDKAVKDLVESQSLSLILQPTKSSGDLTDQEVVILFQKGEDLEVSNATSRVVTIKRGSSHGSGAIISHDGLILTNYHNLYAAEEVDVVLSYGITAKAKVVKKDIEYDLALVKLEGLKTEPLYLSPSGDPTPGEDAWAIGTPGFTELGQSITKGIVSGNRTIEEKSYIQTDASVSPGNSGGPLLNEKGEIIGIVNMKVVADGMEGIGFAIPAKVVMDRLGIKYE